MKIIKFIVIWFVLVGSSVSCNQHDNNDMLPNIDDLYAQPLPVIQKCVQGKWKWLHISQAGFIGFIPLYHTFVEITSDSIVVTQEGDEQVDLKGRFSYHWENKEVFPYSVSQDSVSFATYVMQFNNEQTTTGWYFYNIKNDTLGVGADIPYDYHFYSTYLFSRVK